MRPYAAYLAARKAQDRPHNGAHTSTLRPLSLKARTLRPLSLTARTAQDVPPTVVHTYQYLQALKHSHLKALRPHALGRYALVLLLLLL